MAIVTVDEGQIMLATMALLTNMDGSQLAEVRATIDEMTGHRAPRKFVPGKTSHFWMKIVESVDTDKAGRGGFAFQGKMVNRRQLGDYGTGTTVVVGYTDVGGRKRAVLCEVGRNTLTVETMDGSREVPGLDVVALMVRDHVEYRGGAHEVDSVVASHPILMELGEDHAYLAVWYGLIQDGKVS